jgi:hypothetical protein
MVREQIQTETSDPWQVRMDVERRHAARRPANFFAVQRRGSDEYYRLVTNISKTGFFFQDHVPTEQPGELVVLDFPLPGQVDPVRVTGKVRYVGPRGVGVEVTYVKREDYERLMSVPPPVPTR